MRGKFLLLLVGFSLLFFHSGNYWSSHWLSKWAFLGAVFSFFVSYFTAKRTHALLFPIILWTLLSAECIGMWPTNIYTNVADTVSLLALEKNSLYSYIVVLMACFFVASFKKEWKTTSYFYLAAVGFISATVTATLPKGGGMATGIFSGNPSMNGCLIAAMLPFSLELSETYFPEPDVHWILQIIFAAISLFACYRTDGSVPLGIIGVSFSVWFVIKFFKSRPIDVGLFVISIAAGLFILGHLTVRHQPFLHTSGRFLIWRTMWDWWNERAHVLTGMGLGAVQIVTPLVQASRDPHETNFFIWMHNDWLQALLELGWVGFSFLAIAWGYLAVRVRKEPALAAGFFSFSVMALMNYPLRLPIHCFCFTMICALIIRTTPELAYPGIGRYFRRQRALFRAREVWIYGKLGR